MDDQYPDEDEEEGENRGGTAFNGCGGDRRMRLSMHTVIQFYDLQDRLGYDQPSKTVEWLLKAAAGFEIHHPFSLPPLPPPPLPTPPSTQDDSIPPPSSSQGDPPPTRTPSFDPSRSN